MADSSNVALLAIRYWLSALFGIIVLRVAVGLDVIEDRADDARVDFFELDLRLARVFAFCFARAHDEQDAIYFARQDGGIGDGEKRRRVEQHHIGAFAKELARIWLIRFEPRISAGFGGDCPLVKTLRFVNVGLLQGRIGENSIIPHHVGQARVVFQPKNLVLGRAAQIGIHQNDALAALRDGDCEIRQRGALAFFGARRGDENRAQGFIEIGKFQIRSQSAIRFGNGRTGIGNGNKRIRHA